MDSFSWTDSLRAAFVSCIPCIRSPQSDDEDGDGAQHAIQRDELEGLLESHTDNEADAMSLHSNFGVRGRNKAKRKKRSKGKKSIRLFGYDLFGRPTPDPASDEDDIERQRIPRPTISTSTIDSDAAPVPDSAIDELSRGEWPPQSIVNAEEDARLREEKELRKKRRREKRELKRVAEALAVGVDEDEFEGFPGSGSRLAHSPQITSLDEFGPFKQAGADGQEEEDPDMPDFGGEYLRKTGSSRSGGSGSGSHSRSRSIASGSQSAGATAQYQLLHPQGMKSPHSVPLPSSSASSSFPNINPPSPSAENLEAPLPKRKSKSKTKASKSTTSNQSHSSVTSASMSLPSPPPEPSHAPVKVQVSPESANTFESYSGIKSDLMNGSGNGFPSTGFGSGGGGGGGFPSVGFSGRKPNALNAGAMLARRGDD